MQDDIIALAVHAQSGFDIYVLAVEGLKLSKKAIHKVNGEVTCISLGRLASQLSVLVGTLEGHSVVLKIHAVDSPEAATKSLDSIEFNSGK